MKLATKPPAPTGRILLSLAGRRLDFASWGHKGWRPFLDHISRELGVRGWPEDLEVDEHGGRLIADSAVGCLEMDRRTLSYLASAEGLPYFMAEGICLADPALDRREVLAEIRDLPPDQAWRVAIIWIREDSNRGQ